MVVKIASFLLKDQVNILNNNNIVNCNPFEVTDSDVEWGEY